MVKIIIYILLGFGLILGVFWALKFYNGKKALIECFSSENCIVFGTKGSGKDLIFNKAINARKSNCYANIPYNKDLCIVRDIKEFSVEPNTYESILENNVKIIDKNNKENCDYYISDGGIFLPSQYSQQLIKKYPSLPIYYALSRHLTNSNIHINTQYLGRVWDKLREQAGYFIRATHTSKFIIKRKNKSNVGFLVTTFIVYDSYESASAKVRPYKVTGLITHSESRANKEDFESKHGIVKEYKIIQLVKNVHYDSRWGHRMIYGYNSPDTY